MAFILAPLTAAVTGGATAAGIGAGAAAGATSGAGAAGAAANAQGLESILTSLMSGSTEEGKEALKNLLDSAPKPGGGAVPQDKPASNEEGLAMLATFMQQSLGSKPMINFGG